MYACVCVCVCVCVCMHVFVCVCVCVCVCDQYGPVLGGEKQGGGSGCCDKWWMKIRQKGSRSESPILEPNLPINGPASGHWAGKTSALFDAVRGLVKNPSPVYPAKS